MVNAPTGTAQYLARFSEQSVACNPYAIAKLGIDRSHCSLKIEDYVILCAPFQLGFKKSIFMASLSPQELAFFQKYANTTIGLSIAFNPNKKPEPVKFFIRSQLNTIGQMKGRENVGLFVLEYKTTPDQLILMMGNFLENQERIKIQYEDYGKNGIRMTPETAKLMGYNMYATILHPNPEPRRIQIFDISSKTVEHLEAAGAPVRAGGTAVIYQFFFQKFRITVTGSITEASVLPQGMVRTKSSLSLSPELVEIIDDYWYNKRKQASLPLL
ncbi:MAG: hypothetical protein FWD78_14760 [Treponema sp.]|nr:hypothetical protein [Treponema sp.]